MQRGLHGSLDPTCVIEGSVAKKVRSANLLTTAASATFGRYAIANVRIKT